MKKFLLILIVSMVPVLSFGQDLQSLLNEAVKDIAKGISSNNRTHIKKAEIKLLRSRRLLDKSKKLSVGRSSELINTIKVLLFWCDVVSEDLDENGNELIEIKEISPENQRDTIMQPERSEGEESTSEKGPDAESGLQNLHNLIIEVRSYYSKGNFRDGTRLIEEYVESHEHELSTESKDHLLQYAHGLYEAIRILCDQIATMEGEAVYYKVPGEDAVSKGTIINVVSSQVFIKDGPVQVGRHFTSLLPVYLMRAGQNIGDQNKLILAMFMYLMSKEKVGDFFFKSAKKTDDQTAFSQVFIELLHSIKKDEALREYFDLLRLTQKFLAGKEYSQAFRLIVRIRSLTDSQMISLNEKWVKKTSRPLIEILRHSMTDCRYCGGEYKKVCPDCAGKGKIVKDSQGTSFLSIERDSIRIVRCTTCGGSGFLICSYCKKRRSSSEGKKLEQRLMVLFENTSRKGESK